MTFFQKILSGKKIFYDKNQIIGRGNYGSVFQGLFNNKEVAVKRVLLENVIEREEEAFRQLDHHGNIVLLLHAEYQGDFR